MRTARTMLSARAAKAYVAGLIAAVASAAPVVDDGVSASEVLVAAGAALVAFQAVYWTTNSKAPEQ